MNPFTFYTQKNTQGEAKALLAGIQEGYGFIPNLFAYMAEAPTTIEAYLTMNELVTKSSFTPAQQQIALLAASVENGCEFCIIAHRAIGKMHKSNQQTMDALYSGGKIDDAGDAALVSYVKKVVKQRGLMNSDDIEQFIDAGYTKQQLLEVVLIVSIKTLSNYINHITQPKPNDDFFAML